MERVRKVLKVSADLLVTWAHLDLQVLLVILVSVDHQAIRAYRVRQDSQEAVVLLVALDCLEPRDRSEQVDL